MNPELRKGFRVLLWAMAGLILAGEALAVLAVGAVLSARRGSLVPICIALLVAELIIVFIRVAEREAAR